MKVFPLPILPLTDLVFFPHTSIPILLKDSSLIRMVKDCLNTGQSFGISMLLSHGEKSSSPQRIGTMGRPLLLEESEKGTLKILVQGEKRIELLKLEQNIPYLISKVRELPDLKDSGHLHFDSPKLEHLRNILFSWINDTVRDSLEREAFLQSLGSLHHIVDYLSMFLVQDRKMRQIILENRSLHERVQILSTLLKGKYPDCEDEMALLALKEFRYAQSYDKVMH